jgi:hypothetical protein
MSSDSKPKMYKNVESFREAWWLSEAWWLNGSVPECCPAVPGSNPALPSPQLIAHLLVGCHLGWHLAAG